MIPEVQTRQLGDAVAEGFPFPAYPKGADMFARVLRAAKPALGGLGSVLDAVRGDLDPKVLDAALKSERGGAVLGVALPALLKVDLSPLLSSIPDVLMAIVGDQALVPDLLANTTVTVGGALHRLNTPKAIGAAVGYDYALLAGLVRFALEVNFAGPFVAAFGGLLPVRPASPPAAPTPSP